MVPRVLSYENRGVLTWVSCHAEPTKTDAGTVGVDNPETVPDETVHPAISIDALVSTTTALIVKTLRLSLQPRHPMADGVVELVARMDTEGHDEDISRRHSSGWRHDRAFGFEPVHSAMNDW